MLHFHGVAAILLFVLSIGCYILSVMQRSSDLALWGMVLFLYCDKQMKDLIEGLEKKEKENGQ